MLRKRLIFVLIYCDGFFMQSRNFSLQKVGGIEWIEENYDLRNISFALDEIVVLNVSKNKRSEEFYEVLKRIAEDVFIPISAGGGIRSFIDVVRLFESGADKVVINKILYSNPNLVKKIINTYGSQSVIASVDIKDKKVLLDSATLEIDVEPKDYFKNIIRMKVGEILLNSVERDGTGFGYDFEMINSLISSCSVPVIISGGAGNGKHLLEGLLLDNVSAVSTANLFNFVGDSLSVARKEIIKSSGELLVSWDSRLMGRLNNKFQKHIYG